ncbi:hypothetical protein UFOVP785_91 [uncultured Caudovirales phage]|uniref:Uncharacterized protein n=1 Tax=uncultured Caudovirales phage TaxID=2100421 RepID=A0A6J5NSD4_9CAUD|nr:hypothetical protein UFOVP785_91 [uncultured Caudovirales phage]
MPEHTPQFATLRINSCYAGGISPYTDIRLRVEIVSMQGESATIRDSTERVHIVYSSHLESLV